MIMFEKHRDHDQIHSQMSSHEYSNDAYPPHVRIHTINKSLEKKLDGVTCMSGQ